MRVIDTSLVWILVAAPLVGQVTPTPRRVPQAFGGAWPLIWQVEGSGKLRATELRLLNEQGQEVRRWSGLKATRIRDGQWQICLWLEKGLGGLAPGKYTAEAHVGWLQHGGIREERTEASLRVDGVGEGWLQKAYADQEEFLGALAAGTAWPQGGSFSLSLRSVTAGIRRVRYQVVREEGESVLREWTDLPVGKGSSWTLAGDRKWPEGSAYLWVAVEDAAGRLQVSSRAVWLGALKAGTSATRGSATARTQMKIMPSQQIQPLIEQPAQAMVAPVWLQTLDSGSAPPWSKTNRIATVSAGYKDEERNERQLWPTDGHRPLSLSLTGADRLGKPLYSVSYLLGSRTDSAEVLDGSGLLDLGIPAGRALDVGSSVGVLPAGAERLEIGGAIAPVVFSPGTVEDPYGKSLAKGFGHAAVTAEGSVQSAKDWTSGSPANPPTGLVAIKQASDFVARRVEESAGLQNIAPENLGETAMDENRSPFAFTLPSQDPSGRVLVAKGLGARKDPLGDVDVISAIASQALPAQIWNFDSPEAQLPPEIQLNAWASIQGVAGAGFISLLAPYSVPYDYDCTRDPDYPERCSGVDTGDGGSVRISLGQVAPGTNGTAVFMSSGTVSVFWVVNGVRQTNAAYTFTDAADHTVTVDSSISSEFPPFNLAMDVVNSAPVQGTTPPPVELNAVVDNVRVNLTSTLPLVQVNDANLQRGLVAGFTHTQYGVGTVPGYGACQATLVVDPDGASVVEVKDPEGRTIYKIVNPTIKYLAGFKDYKGDSLYPSEQVRTVPLSQSSPDANVQDLVTAYGFDAEGHLRVVVPPMGFKSMIAQPPSGTVVDPTWGARLDEVHADSVLAWTPMSNDMRGVCAFNQGGAVAYATYNAYDQSGHLVATYTPDEGLTRFIVDQKGRVHFSQTAGQRARNAWTRTIFDGVLRVAAVGEVADQAWGDGELAGKTDVRAAFLGLGDTPYRAMNTYDLYADDTEAWGDALAGVDTTVDGVTTRTWPNLPSALGRVVPLLPGKELWQPFADGHLTQTSDGKAIERYCYDQDGRIVIRWVQLKQGDGSWRHFAIGIYYDFAGRVKRLVYPSGPGGNPLQVVYTYDELGRLYAVGTPQDKAYFARYAYQPTGEVRAIIYGPGEGFVAKRMLQDPQGWLRTLTVQGR